MSKLRSDFWQTADTLELILALSDEAAGDSWNPRGCPHHWLFLWDRAIGSEGGKLKVVARGGKTRRRVTRTQLREGTPPIGALYTQATTFPEKSRWVDMWTAVLRMKVWFLESQNPPNHHDIRLTSNRSPLLYIQEKTDKNYDMTMMATTTEIMMMIARDCTRRRAEVWFEKYKEQVGVMTS